MGGLKMLNNIYRFSLFVLLSGMLMWECSEHDQILNSSENSPQGKFNNNLNLELLGTTLLTGYTFDYLAQTFDGSFTTFSYKVTGNNYPPALSFFLIEIPECYRNIDITYTPTKTVVIGLDPVTGIYGIKWSFPVDIDASQEYTITFNGFVEEGIT